MNKRPLTWFSLLLLGLMVAALACNFPGAQDPTSVPPTDTPVPPKRPTDTPVPDAVQKPDQTGDPLLVTRLEDVKSATVQIEAEGSFVDPQVGLELNVAGRGSGFIIHPSGIAVTNNHVVTGAALLRVWVGGESTPRNARVLGVSECSDLAVIDIDGDDYSYLQWYEGDITTGLDVYAAGYPLGDPEFTLTRGIVSKERADGETDWASVDWVIEHDATINPGNSGGPLVTGEGQVVGVNYASSPSYNQYFAIGRVEALPVIEQLNQELDVASIGVNGTAVYDDYYNISGIWVASVESGSPAERSGVRGGDVITMIEGLILATDGTMSSYCDILRSHTAQDTLSIQVYRFASEEVMEGQLNGRQLVTSFSFAQQFGGQVGVQPPGGAPVYDTYVEVYDDTGAIRMEVPSAWGDIDGRVLEDEDGVIGAAIKASSNIEAFDNTYDTPGVIFLASDWLASAGDAAELLDLFDFSDDCYYNGRYDYSDPLYSGYYDEYTACQGTDTLLFVVVAMPPDRAYASVLVVQAVSEADLEAVDHIFDTFVVVGDLPGDGGGVGPGGPGTGEGTITLYNNSDTAIWYVYISPSSSDSWGEDWLGEDVLMPGDYYTFYVPYGEYDLAAADPDDALVLEEYNVIVDGAVDFTIPGSGSGPGGGSTGQASLTVVNDSSSSIWYVYIAPSTESSWGEDWLGENTIPPGDSFTFYMPQGQYDLAAADPDDNIVAERYEVLLDGDYDWTLYDESDGYWNFTVVNNLGRDICLIYISESTSSSWGDDWLGADILGSGNNTTFMVPGDLTYDLQVWDCNGDVVDESYDIDVYQDVTWVVAGSSSGGSSGPLSADISWDTWSVGSGGVWKIRFNIVATGGDGNYSYQVLDHGPYYASPFEIEWGCAAAFTGDIVVRSGDGQTYKQTEWIPVPGGCY